MFIKSFAVLLAFIALTNAFYYSEILGEEWKTFQEEFGKIYESTTEERLRFRIFADNKLYIVKHNHEYALGKVSYELGINEFADLLNAEFNEIMNGFNYTIQELQEESDDGITFITPENINIPASLDWRTQGAVTGVKNQGPCGSCWAFASTGTLEGQHFRKTKALVSLSEQNLLDCSSKYGNFGCKGGIMDNAFRYIRDNKGIDTEISYPYSGIEGPCRFKRNTVGATVTGYVNLPAGNEQKLLEAVATQGPVSIAIDASHRSFQFYKAGVYDESACSNIKLNHGVVVVGYGVENNRPHWIVKNSWGAGWGDHGYIKMSRNKGNQCGIASHAIYPTV